ncbi:DUF4097 family beta strand repeat-containing protein [Actinoplanes sp. NPDC023801]|uniref:DUF4097 family beta strand repeat-containing protein n=1 Tax=Actinoplanes sp. NPDC023801 TaxID=3154595 RepID=UPI00340A9045
MPYTSTTAPMRTAWRTLGTAATVLVLVVVGVLGWTWFGPRRTGDAHFEQSGATKVTVRTGDGDVTVRSGPGDKVTVDSDLSWSTMGEPDANAAMRGDTFEVVGRCPTVVMGSECTVDFVVHVPDGVAVEVITEGGTVQASGLTGPVRLTSAAGDVKADDLSGDVVLRSEAGSITGSGLRAANVEAGLDAGDLDLTFAAVPTAVTAVADAGDITLALAPGPYRVQVETGNGEPQISVTDDRSAPSSVTARTGAGSVTVRYAG